MKRKAHDIDSYIRRLKQIGEHEIADVMQKLCNAMEVEGCVTCAHYDKSADEHPCVTCRVNGSRINWEWEGWQNDV